MCKMLKEIFVQVALIHFVLSAPEIRKCFATPRSDRLKTFSKGFPNNDEPVLKPPDETLKTTTPSTSHHRPSHIRDDTPWTQPLGPLGEKSREFWQSSGQEILREALLREPNRNVANNLIILVAAGMSIPTQMASRVYLGGEDKVLSFEEFPYVGLSKVRRRKLFALNNAQQEKFLPRHTVLISKCLIRAVHRQLS